MARGRRNRRAIASGVLTHRGVELNTTAGHLAALGATPSPYPMAGTPADVIEDVHRLGGIGVAAHPESPRAVAQLAGWDVPLAIRLNEVGGGG